MRPQPLLTDLHMHCYVKLLGLVCVESIKYFYHCQRWAGAAPIVDECLLCVINFLVVLLLNVDHASHLFAFRPAVDAQ
jgi:hypothetical protein